MRHLPLLISLLALCGWTTSAYAFFDKDIRTLTMQEGLADNTVTALFRDDDGFIWLGTDNGLSRYDGRSVSSFRPSSFTFSCAKLIRFSEDYIGILSGNRLYAFHRKLETFADVTDDAGNPLDGVNGVLAHSDSTFWLVSAGRLLQYRWRKDEGKQWHVGPDTGEQPQQSTVSVTGLSHRLQATPVKDYRLLTDNREAFNAFCADDTDASYLWLTTSRGNLLRVCTVTGEVAEQQQLDNGRPLQVTSLLCHDSLVWVSTIARGIVRYHRRTGELERISYGGTGAENLLSHTDVYETLYMGQGRYLAVTWCGYTLLIVPPDHPEKLISEVYTDVSTQIYRYLESRMIAACYDPAGVLWIGTSGGGVIYSDIRTQFYNRYNQKRHNEVSGILMDDNRYVWLATFHQGLLRSRLPYDGGRNLSFELVEESLSEEERSALCALKTADGKMWFGRKSGQFTMVSSPRGERTTIHLVVDGVPNCSPVRALCADASNGLWVGTDRGVLHYDPSTGHCEQISLVDADDKISTSGVYVLARTADGSLWVGTKSYGVYRLTKQADGRFLLQHGYEQEAGVPFRSVRSLLSSSDGFLYVGYEEGLMLLSPVENKAAAAYTTADGLCSNFIGCIVEDGAGHIWLGSNSGISRYSRRQHLFYNYYISGSNRAALFADSALFFGNNRSLTMFDPQKVDAWSGNDKVFVTGLEVNNRPVGVGQRVNGQVVLNCMAAYADRVVLQHKNRDFAFTFSNLSYAGGQQKYAYRLLPYQSLWQVADDGGKAAYMNLEAGNYRFEVCTLYPSGHTGQVTSLPVVIRPHWSDTLAFRLFLLVVALMLLFWCIRLLRIRQQRTKRELQMQHELLVADMEREKERQVRLERDNFFTAAAHELRTPLTLVLAPLEELMGMERLPNAVRNRLQTIRRNATSLHTLVDHLLYVQKIEAGMVKLRIEQTDLVRLVREVTEVFGLMAVAEAFASRPTYPRDHCPAGWMSRRWCQWCAICCPTHSNTPRREGVCCCLSRVRRKMDRDTIVWRCRTRAWAFRKSCSNGCSIRL